MPITISQPWTGPNGITFPVGTYFVHSAAWGVWDWKTPNGTWGQSNFEEARPGEEN